ncbi:TonB-dependent receptor plug domain-containing protein [Avibacterium avium]|uniref:TonB-dependent receptor, beta-barrel domain protein n=1 Tax=Avibacterium avium TaxID=751 RepID=A0A379AST3_AVIAV|nr:TonB-dependent receptor [Avibacterium avium]SUB24757.1 TonB-dependent receptor, beta-barrel domain protein [Avibacterium avium]
MQKNIITTAILLSFSTALYAAENAAQSEQLAPIYVYSAYATPVSEDQTASSVTVLTEKDFAERNATYVSDVLKTVPSVAMGALGGRGTLTSLYLRGADSNQTAVIIDGVKVNPVSGYGYDFGGLSLSNIDRIEVLRGEQSALWGSDAMGGVVYITTNSGLYKDKPFNVDFDLGTGSKGTYDGSLTLSGQQNGFYYSLHGDSHRTKGISAFSSDRFHYTAEDGSSVSTGGAKERDKFHRDALSLRMGYDDGEKGIDLLASHFSQTAHFDNLYATETVFDDYTRTRETTFKLSGYVGSEKELFKHKASVSHQKTDSDTLGRYPSSYDAKKLNANYQLDINFDREGELQQALSLLTEYQRSSYYDFGSYGDSEKHLIEKSVAAEYRLFSENDHSLSLSGRYIDSNQYDNSFTGRIAGTYRVLQNLKAHASFGTAIQNPTITEYYGYSSYILPNPNLKPEKSKGGDIGLLFETTDKRHSLDVTYFARNVKNFIESEKLPNYRSYYVNKDGTTKIKGVEIAYNGKITDDLSAYANYTYTQTKDSNGQALVRRPKHMANLGLAYQITEALGANVNVNYVGKRIDTYFDETTYDSSRVKMPSYTLVSLGANYQVTPNLNVYANLNNLFDKKYESVAGYGQYGRTLYVGLKGSF